MDLDERLTRVPPDKDHPADFKPRFADKASWEVRAAALRSQVQVALGLWPMPPRPPVEAELFGSIARDGYTIATVALESLPGHRVTGNLYRPAAAGPHPAVLHPHGHFEGGRFMWRRDEQVARELDSGAERRAEAARSPMQAACATLARTGCVVLQYDMVGYGDSHVPPHREGFLDAAALLHLRSAMGLQTWDGLRALDFLLALPDVDPTRVGLVGASSGATQLIALAALDERVTCTCPIVMVSMAMQGGCVCENAPLYRIGTNNVELACLSAPRPQLVIAADDWTRDFQQRGLPEMKAIYGLYGAGSDVSGITLAYPHNFNVHSREQAYAFLSHHLGLGDRGFVTEPPFEPVLPVDLSAHGNGRARPDDEADAAAIRAWMQSSANAELASLAAQAPAAHRSLMRVAMRAMLTSDLPEPGDVERVGSAGSPTLKAGTQWEGVVRRVGSGERVACGARVPEQWDGSVTILTSLDDAAATPLDATTAVLAIKPFETSNRPTAAEREPRPPNQRYAGYWLGYARSIVAERAHDLLTTMAFGCRLSRTGRVRVFAARGTAAWAVPAMVLAGEAVEASTIISDGWDYSQISSDDDPLLLPGAMKYGGLRGFLRACEHPPEVRKA